MADIPAKADMRSAPAGAEPYSLMLMGFGQSNADIHDAGPREYPAPDQQVDIYMPNDARGFRGWGYLPRTQDITGFLPVSDASPKVQSLLAAAAGRILAENDDDALKRVIIRSGAVGGRRFGGIQKDDIEVPGIYTTLNGETSLIYNQFVDTIRQCVTLSRQDGPPIAKVYVVWLHGESDRAMDRATYTDNMLRMMRETEDRLSDLGVPIHWGLIQPAGSGDRGGGNAWPNRVSVFDVADAHDTAFVSAAAYGYEMIDGSHFAGPGKLRLGEMIGLKVARHMRDAFQPLPLPSEMELTGNKAVVRFPEGTQLSFEDSAFPTPGPGLGFSCNPISRTQVLSARLLDPATIELEFDVEPKPEVLVVQYAFMHNRRNLSSVPASDFPVGRGCLRTGDAIPSQLTPGEVLYDWVPGFSISAKGGVNPI